MSDSNIQKIKELLQDFSDMSLTDFRQAIQVTLSEADPQSIQYLIKQLKDYRGNRSLRAAIAGGLADLEDENFLDDFAEVIEFETDVSLCRECIQGIVRMGTVDSHNRLVRLAKEKPNATIATLLRQELEKLNQKEPSEYYFENLKKGDTSPRASMTASRVLITIGDVKIVPRILTVMEELDGLGRVEAARVVAQLGQAEHLQTLLPLLENFISILEKRIRLGKELEHLKGLEKSERIGLLCNVGETWIPESRKSEFLNYQKLLKNGDLTDAQSIKTVLEKSETVGLPFFLDSLYMLFQNQVASAAKFHEETLKANRVQISRSRQLIGFLAEGIGRMLATDGLSDEIRQTSVAYLEKLFTFPFPDIQKMVLFGMAHFLKPDDENLIHLAEESVQVEGLIRLLTRLGKRKDAGFIPFFLRLVEHHQLVDIQELALQSLAALPGVESELKRLFDAGTHDSLRTAIRVVGSTQTHSLIPVLLGYLENQSDFLRIEVIKALGKIPGDSHLPAIEKVLYDAKNPDLVEACLDALAEISSQESVECLKQFTLKTQNRIKALSALEHLVHYYHRWDFPLPADESEFTLGLLKEFIFDRDKNIRKKAYTISARLVTWDLDLYHQIRELLKDAGSKLRAQSNWDKHEKPLLEKSQKALNRSFYFLKDALENQEKINSILRQSENANATRWIENFEKINKLIDISEYPFSSDFYTLLAETIQKLLPEKTAWRERILLYNLAGFTREKSLIPLLTAQLKTVSKQARNALIQALNLLGYSMKQISSINQIKKVLLVEGSGFFRKRLVTFLEKMDLEVYSATDVHEVEQFFSEQQPDLLLTEATLKSSGDLIPEIVRWKSSRQGLELIVQTNLRDAESLKPLVALSPRGILFKPFPLDQLKNMIVQ